MQHCTQRVFLLSMKDFIMYCRSEFLHALLMNQLWVWSAALLLWSSHLLWPWWQWLILGGWSLGALGFLWSFICTFHSFMEPYQVSGAQQYLDACIVCKKTLTDLQNLGQILHSCFPSGFVGGLRKMLKLSHFHTESHSPVSAEPTSCRYCLYDLLLHPWSTFLKKKLLSFYAGAKYHPGFQHFKLWDW